MYPRYILCSLSEANVEERQSSAHEIKAGESDLLLLFYNDRCLDNRRDFQLSDLRRQVLDNQHDADQLTDHSASKRLLSKPIGP